MDHVNFGWLPECRGYAGDNFRIEPVADFDEAVATVRQSRNLEEDWYYRPRIDDEPKPAEWFKLPYTHTLHVDEEVVGRHRLSTFLVFVLGYLKGLRLIPEPWVHVYRVPTRLHQLQDFHVYEPATSRILDRAWAFWRSNDIEVRTAMIGALHWHALGRTYEHPYEVFHAQYTVLGACWSIYAKLTNHNTQVPHAERPAIMALKYGIVLPEWAQVSAKTSYLSRLRNALAHEALWAGEPIGLAHPHKFPSIHVELYRLNSRILLALLGDGSAYIGRPMASSMSELE